MSLKVLTSVDGRKIYDLAAGKDIPEWLTRTERRALSKADPLFSARVEVLSGYTFPHMSQKIRFSPDGQYVAAVGTHPPQLHMYDLSTMALKFERHINCEAIDLAFLSQDYRKLALLREDRVIDLHNQGGFFWRCRVPRTPRGMTWNQSTACLLVGGSSSDLWRLNLHEGHFETPLKTDFSAINAVSVSPLHGLTVCACEEGPDGEAPTGGGLQAFDFRCGAHESALLHKFSVPVTAVAHSAHTPYLMAVGLGSGEALLYDLRASVPLNRRDHHTHQPIHTIMIHPGVTGLSVGSDTRRVISADASGIRIWNASDAKLFAAIPFANNLSHFDVSDGASVKYGSGLILSARETPRMGAHFIPDLGPAPNWIPSLESAVVEAENMASRSSGQFSDFRFVTLAELERLHLGNIIGTNLCAAYMHGFYVSEKLLQQAEQNVDPFALERWRKERLEAKIREKRESEITSASSLRRKRKPVQNPSALTGEDGAASTNSLQSGKPSASVSNDARFRALFTDELMHVDDTTLDYAATGGDLADQAR